MIQVRIDRNNQDDVIGLRVEGHSGYAASGSDIVCSAVSAVVQTAILGVREVAGCGTDLESGEALIAARFLPGESGRGWPEAQAILEAMVLGLEEIADGRARYVRIVQRKEVR